ncbi:UNVERIFIED_CONTAM: hypothetical protein K2H54_018051 [Gekko kuhli]
MAAPETARHWGIPPRAGAQWDGQVALRGGERVMAPRQGHSREKGPGDEGRSVKGNGGQPPVCSETAQAGSHCWGIPSPQHSKGLWSEYQVEGRGGGEMPPICLELIALLL